MSRTFPASALLPSVHQKTAPVTLSVALVVVLSFAWSLRSQERDPRIQSIIDQTNIDLLVLSVNELSGEIPAVIGGSPYTITTRTMGSEGNDRAADYLIQRMKRYGFSVQDQQYSTTGRNILAFQTGYQYPQRYFFICAHYDDRVGPG